MVNDEMTNHSTEAVEFGRVDGFRFIETPPAVRYLVLELPPAPGSWGVRMEIPDDVNMETFAAALRSFALAAGYHPETVDQFIPEH